ncbi:hypothetical protein OEA41_010815 [Lepraria neglecta]|uniref:Uncharacterized protein n=1 Tax=Lepraria neglecta TaxID=209136 RepID=A0AAD9YZM5_9LECA|nr:hypothetical protein OEA41_010815 [Lepraria neglecta]
MVPGTPPPGSTTASKRQAIALNTVQPSDTVLHCITASSALTPLNLEKRQNYVTNQNPESLTPSQNPEQPQLFNPEGVESSILGITFVGVVPVAALLAFVAVKMFRWQQRKQKRGLAIGGNGVKRINSQPSLQQPYLQPKAELDAEQARQEIEARERRYETDGADAVSELPVAHDGLLSLGLTHELKGDEHSTELEVPEP